MSFDLVVLEGRSVRLEPLAMAHAAGLAGAVADGALWELPVTLVPRPDEIDQFIADAEAEHQRGEGLAFATIDRASGTVAGSTRFMKANVPHRRVEIGFTFLGASHQRTALNTEAKYLMLTHAFETLGMNRVELLTDRLNTRSRRAILRLGAQKEGVLRSHMVMRDGRIRDSVVYSITRAEWPEVKANLLRLMAKATAAAAAGTR